MRTAEPKGILSTQEKEDSKISGTVAGGRKAAKTNMLRHGEDFYRVLGARGGRNGKGPDYKGGFASDKKGKDGLTGRERARIAGYKGGRVSRRTGAKNGDEE